ncbi:hypothetical protein SDC9_201174 [bioreactor metagenome]|uniref:Uncharacterized protein n=1 Tax=bioreactor metagenome TaxID=1076179 RepID=A0A645IRE8_9ZZZZ
MGIKYHRGFFIADALVIFPGNNAVDPARENRFIRFFHFVQRFPESKDPPIAILIENSLNAVAHFTAETVAQRRHGNPDQILPGLAQTPGGHVGTVIVFFSQLQNQLFVFC